MRAFFFIKVILFTTFVLLLFFVRIPDKEVSAGQTFPQVLPMNYVVAPKLYVLDGNMLAENKRKLQDGDVKIKQSYDYLIKQANALLKESPVSVVEKKQLPPSGNKHDYLSLATYYWPNPNTPSGLPYVVQDGKVNPELKDIPDNIYFKKMAQTVNILSLAYYFSGNSDYRDHAYKFLKVWFIDTNTRMSPNLEYSQLTKGDPTIRGGGIIDLNSLPSVLDSIGLLTYSKPFSVVDSDSLQKWFTDFLQWMLTSEKGKKAGGYTNNIGTWYDVQIASMALYTNNKNLAQRIVIESKIKRISLQIENDGKQPQELRRTISWDYSVSNLTALFNLASVAHNAGVDLWNFSTTDGRSLKKGLEFLLPTLEGAKWPYTQIKTISPLTMPSLLRNARGRFEQANYWPLADKYDPNFKNSQDKLLYTDSTMINELRLH